MTEPTSLRPVQSFFPDADDDEVDDYWAPEPLENKAVAEWWGQQPESGQVSS